MNVNYSFLDNNFNIIASYEQETCFSDIMRRKTGKYLSYNFAVENKATFRKFYREMVKVWGDLLEHPPKKLGKKTHIIMDMDKHSINLILSVFSSFRFMEEAPLLIDYYCYLRNKYRKLPIFVALLLVQAAESPGGQEHCFIPWSGVPICEEAFTSLMGMSLESKITEFQKQIPMNRHRYGQLFVHKSWGYIRDYYRLSEFSTRKKLAERLIVKMFYKKGRK